MLQTLGFNLECDRQKSSNAHFFIGTGHLDLKDLSTFPSWTKLCLTTSTQSSILYQMATSLYLRIANPSSTTTRQMKWSNVFQILLEIHDLIRWQLHLSCFLWIQRMTTMLKSLSVEAQNRFQEQATLMIRARESILDMRSPSGRWILSYTQDWCQMPCFLRMELFCSSMDARRDLLDTSKRILYRWIQSQHLSFLYTMERSPRERDGGRSLQLPILRECTIQSHSASLMDVYGLQVQTTTIHQTSRLSIQQNSESNTLLLHTCSNRQLGHSSPTYPRYLYMAKRMKFISTSIIHSQLIHRHNQALKLRCFVRASAHTLCTWVNVTLSWTTTLVMISKPWRLNHHLMRTYFLLDLPFFTSFAMVFLLKERMCLLLRMKTT